jgi:hypothetical protein
MCRGTSDFSHAPIVVNAPPTRQSPEGPRERGIASSERGRRRTAFEIDVYFLTILIVCMPAFFQGIRTLIAIPLPLERVEARSKHRGSP